jgi:hypothetical protein
MVPNFILGIYIRCNFVHKKKASAFPYGQVHNHLTGYSSDCNQVPHNLEIYNSRAVIAGFKLFSTLPAYFKQIRDNWPLKTC